MKIISKIDYQLQVLAQFVMDHPGFASIHMDDNLRDRHGEKLYRVALAFIKSA
jgi:hypothetical protein